MAKETFSRRNLPHWYMPQATHFVTFRLAGTLPRQVLDDLAVEKERLLQRKVSQSLKRVTASGCTKNCFKHTTNISITIAKFISWTIRVWRHWFAGASISGTAENTVCVPIAFCRITSMFC